MKKTKYKTTLRKPKGLLFILAIVGLTSIFTGCKDDEEPIVEDKTTITVASPADGATQIYGSTISLNFTANSDNGLKSVMVRYKSATGAEKIIFDSTFVTQLSNYNYIKNFVVGEVGTETYTISVTDKSDNIKTTSINVKSITGFSAEDFGTFFHALGSKNGAYDLLKSEQRTLADNDGDKDMENTDGAGAFTGAWIAKNNTMYIKASTFDYNIGTINEAKTLYAAGTPKPDVFVPVNGDIYIAKLRGTDAYTIIKVIDISPTNDECGCSNKGKMTFSFKKTI